MREPASSVCRAIVSATLPQIRQMNFSLLNFRGGCDLEDTRIDFVALSGNISLAQFRASSAQSATGSCGSVQCGAWVSLLAALGWRCWWRLRSDKGLRAIF
jgi:hypothetical protein